MDDIQKKIRQQFQLVTDGSKLLFGLGKQSSPEDDAKLEAVVLGLEKQIRHDVVDAPFGQLYPSDLKILVEYTKDHIAYPVPQLVEYLAYSQLEDGDLKAYDILSEVIDRVPIKDGSLAYDVAYMSILEQRLDVYDRICKDLGKDILGHDGLVSAAVHLMSCHDDLDYVESLVEKYKFDLTKIDESQYDEICEALGHSIICDGDVAKKAIYAMPKIERLIGKKLYLAFVPGPDGHVYKRCD